MTKYNKPDEIFHSEFLSGIPSLNIEENGMIKIYRGLKNKEPDFEIDRKRQTCWTLSYSIAREYALYNDPSTLAGRSIKTELGYVVSVSAPTSMEKIRNAIEARNGHGLEMERRIREGEHFSFSELFAFNKVLWIQQDEYELLKDFQIVDFYVRL